jgi:hypothetical protein
LSSGIEVCECKKQQLREYKTGYAEHLAIEIGGDEDIANEYCHTYAQRTPVVEMVWLETVEEEHPHHDQTCQIKHVEDKLYPCVLKPEMNNSIKHDANGNHSGHGCD